MSEGITSKVQAEVIINLTLNQKADLEPLLNCWVAHGGLMVGGLAQQENEIKVGFRLVPDELGRQIIKIVDDYYGGNSDVV